MLTAPPHPTEASMRIAFGPGEWVWLGEGASLENVKKTCAWACDELTAGGRPDKAAKVARIPEFVKEGKCRNYYYWHRKRKTCWRVLPTTVAPKEYAELYFKVDEWLMDRLMQGKNKFDYENY